MRTSHPSWIGPRAHQQVAVVPLPVLCVGGSLDIGGQRHPRVIWANQPVSSVNSGFLANLAKSSRTLLCLRIHSAGVIGPVARQNQQTLCELYASVLPNVEFLEPWETETLPARPALPCQGHCFVGPSMRRALHQSCWPPRDDAHSTAAQRPLLVLLDPELCTDEHLERLPLRPNSPPQVQLVPRSLDISLEPASRCPGGAAPCLLRLGSR